MTTAESLMPMVDWFPQKARKAQKARKVRKAVVSNTILRLTLMPKVGRVILRADR